VPDTPGYPKHVCLAFWVNDALSKLTMQNLIQGGDNFDSSPQKPMGKGRDMQTATLCRQENPWWSAKTLGPPSNSSTKCLDQNFKFVLTIRSTPTINYLIIMTYGDHKMRMLGTKKAASFGKPGGQLIGTKELAGTKAFCKIGEEADQLRVLMEAHGPAMQTLTPIAVTTEDPYFLDYKFNSLKANILYIKKEFAQRGYVKHAFKCLFGVSICSNN
jgi:hypothetical protein